MDKTTYNTVYLLDHGFVILRNIAGITPRRGCEFDANDIDPANVARMSFDNIDKERTVEQDLKLYRYLIAHGHSTPIESIEVWFEIKLPIFVCRQFYTHRTRTANEISGRYITLPSEWYIPNIVGAKSKDKKQGRSDTLPQEVQNAFQKDLDTDCGNSYHKYLFYLEKGVCPEQARCFLHVNHYTHITWKQNLWNLMHFLKLRMDEHAQWEIREYAESMFHLVKQVLPKSMEYFEEFISIKGAKKQVQINAVEDYFQFLQANEIPFNTPMDEVYEYREYLNNGTRELITFKQFKKKFGINTKLKIYSVWLEGFSGYKRNFDAQFLGEIKAESFQEACAAIIKQKEDAIIHNVASYSMALYNEVENTYQITRRFFETEEEARKSFG